MPLSEERVVAQQLKNRMKIEHAYSEKAFPSHLLSSVGEMDSCENIQLTYIDQDALIERAALTKMQRAVIELVMRGRTITDIAQECERPRSTIQTHFVRGVHAIVRANEERWLEFYGEEKAQADD